MSSAVLKNYEKFATRLQLDYNFAKISTNSRVLPSFWKTLFPEQFSMPASAESKSPIKKPNPKKTN